MPSFLRMGDGTYISVGAIRTIKYGVRGNLETGPIEVEFTDGSTRTYPPSDDVVHALDGLVGDVFPAPPGWQAAHYDTSTGKVVRHDVIGFRLLPDGCLSAITWWGLCSASVLVDPQGQFLGYRDEADFLAAAKARARGENPLPGLRIVN